MEYITTRQVMNRFGWTSRATVSMVALREEWRRERRYISRYAVDDVDQYALDREHTIQARQRGLWHKRGLIRHRKPEIVCPICEEKKNGSLS